MELELVKALASNGVLGILAGLLLWFYQQDHKESGKRLIEIIASQADLRREEVQMQKELRKALSDLTVAIASMPRNQ